MGSTTATVRFNAAAQAPSAVVSLATSGAQPTLENVSNCSRNTQPVVTLRARVGTMVDAAGFSCNEP